MLGHSPALTAASDAAVHGTFSCTDTTACGPCYEQVHSNDSNSKEKKKKSFLFSTEIFSVIWFSTRSGKRRHCIAAELEMNGWGWAKAY